MNYKMVFYSIGRMMRVVGLLMLLPMIIAFFYKEDTWLAFLLPVLFLVGLGFVCDRFKPKNTAVYAREGFVITAACWVLMSVFGSLPFLISGAIPSFIDCLFETVSGFTTTGASILTNVEALPKSLLFWRSFTHWIGGMGVLVFMLAIVPKTDNSDIHLMRAEVPGPNVGSGKLVSKLGATARILYGVYIALTLLQILLLLLGDMPALDSVLHAFGTAGTGGFGIKNNSVAYYDSAYLQGVITVFMILFGINFNIFYFILIGKLTGVLRSEELRTYLLIIIAAIAIITINIANLYSNVWEALRYSSFQVASIITTTGYVTANYDQWPMLSQIVLVLLMFIGSCAGSTGGGFKISRLLILIKSSFYEIRRAYNPGLVSTVKLDGKSLDRSAVSGVTSYFAIYMLIYAISTLLISFDGFDFATTTSSVAACFNNIGPGLSMVGAVGNYSAFSVMSKLVLSFDMLAGRLELLPMLLLFSPSVWKRY